MLKIKDATGKVVGTLKDEDNAPEMVEEDPKEVSKKKNKKQEEEGEEEDVNQ